MRLFLIVNIIGVVYSLYVNPVFIYYKNRPTLSCAKKEDNNSEEAYKKLMIELNKIKSMQIEREKTNKENKKGLNLTEIRNHVNYLKKNKNDELDNIGYLNNENDDENPFWHEY